MTNLNIPVGVSDFSQIRENGYYYVDKTGLIWKDAGYEYAGTFFRYST